MILCVRRATINDIIQVNELYKKKDIVNNEPVGARYTIMDFLHYIADDRCIFLVCADNDDIAGFLLGFDLNCWCYVDVLIVRDLDERKGIGSMLVNFLLGMNNCWDRIEMCYYVDDRDVDIFFDKNRFEFNKVLTRWVSRNTRK